MSIDPTAQAALTLFKEELSSEETAVRVNTIHRLPLVIHLISNSSSAKEALLNTVDSLIDTIDDDEVLFGLAQAMTSFSGYYPIQRLFPLYDKLLASEETFVRDKTVESFLKMTRKMERPEIANTLVPFITKLAGTQTFGAKMSVLAIMADIFPVLNQEEKGLILEKIGQMFTEESLILRRNLASKIGKICRYLPKETLTIEIINHFKNLTNDDSDSVRIITIESLIELATVFNDEENKSFVIPLIIQMTGDKSWRVKLHLAKHFAKLANAVGKDIADNSLISIFSTLLRDPENEVRVAAVRSLKDFVSCLNPDKIAQIFAYLQSMAKDNVALVRVGACEVLQKILNIDPDQIGKEVIKTRIQPILVDLCQDKDVEVKIEIMKVIPLWAKSVGTYLIDLMSNGTLNIPADSPNWRLRLAVVDCFINIGAELKNPKVFEKNLKKTIQSGTTDKSFQLRKHIIKSMKTISTFVDDAGFIDAFWKEYLKVLADPSQFYTFRVSAVYGLEATFGIIKAKDKLKDQYFKALAKSAEDPLVNLRQVAIKMLILSLTKGWLTESGDQINTLLAKIKGSEKDGEIKFILSEHLK